MPDTGPKERPILYRPEMVRAKIEGRKTVTRRIIKPRRDGVITGPAAEPFHAIEAHGGGRRHVPSRIECVPCPYGVPGDRLWIREAWFQEGKWVMPAWPEADGSDREWHGTKNIGYSASNEKPEGWRARPSIHMFRWASRFLDELVSVNVERLLDITEDGARAEGFESRLEFLTYWDELNKKPEYSAKSNPWVWVLKTKPIEAPHV